ncbi:MAG: xanthine dehydrogenase family protein molybdopterin-binding subunit [Ferrimicrobium sp.]
MSILGNRVLRTEDPNLLQGRGNYVANAPLSDPLVATFAISPFAHARITAIDTSVARSLAGVVAVWTAADLDLAPPRSILRDRPDTARPYLATDTVRFVGEPVAIVVASSAEIAEDACDAIVVDYEPLPVVVDPEEAATDSVRLFAGGSNVVTLTQATVDPEFFVDADVVVVQRLINQRLAPAPLETRALAARVSDDGRLQVLASTQSAHQLKAAIARALELDPDQILVQAKDVGGGFGAKATVYPEDIVVAMAAWRLRREIRWVEDRSRSMIGLAHGRGQIQYLELGAKADGTLCGYRIHIIQDAGAYPIVGAVLPQLTVLMSAGTYRLPKVATSWQSIVTNTTPTAAYRGAGRPEAAAAIERMMDLLASELSLDPAELRRRNFIASNDFPVTTQTGATYDSGDYQRALATVLDAGRYEALRTEQARRCAAGAPLALGIGLSSYVEITNGFTSSEYGRVAIESDGRATVYSGTSPHGQGHATAWAMLVQEQLGIPMDKITVITGDTDQVPRGVGTFGSRSLQVGGVAVHTAAIEVLEKARNLAAELLEAAPSDLVPTEDGSGLMVAGSPGSEISWSQLASRAAEPLEATVDFEPSAPTFPFGAHLAVVEVDTDTGAVRLVELIALDDAGKIVNPMLAEGQVHGGLAQGVAQALTEVMSYDPTGTPLTGTFADYGIISAAELPSFTILHQETPSPINALGVKGIGESGTIGSTPAVWNAVIDALSYLGVRHIDMPLTAERVWNAIQEVKS